MAEFEEAFDLANRLLDEPNTDPDDDLRMLARQFLRGCEVVTWYAKQYVPALKELFRVRTEMYRAALRGTVRDTKAESEYLRAAVVVEQLEGLIPDARRSPRDP